MLKGRSSSPIKDTNQTDDDSFNESIDILDISLNEISSGSSKKCSDSECSLCEKIKQKKINGDVSNKSMDSERKTFQRCRFELQNSLINSSSSSSSEDTRNLSILKDILNVDDHNASEADILQNLNINNFNNITAFEHNAKFKRPFALENNDEKVENDETFLNLVHVSFHTSFKDDTKNSSEYHKLAELCALSKLKND